MIQAVQVLLEDGLGEAGEPIIVATATKVYGHGLCRSVAATKQAAIDRIEFQLVLLGVPFTLYVRDDCRRTTVRVIVEHINESGVIVATAFDGDGAYVCDGACCCTEGAITKCLKRLPRGSYDLTIDVLNPNEDESDADCW